MYQRRGSLRADEHETKHLERAGFSRSTMAVVAWVDDKARSCHPDDRREEGSPTLWLVRCRGSLLTAFVGMTPSMHLAIAIT